MSSELENQIKDDLFRDKIIYFYSKYKKYLITLLILLVTIPSFYQIFKAYDRHRSEKILESYSEAVTMYNNNNKNETIEKLSIILKEKNETLILLALNKIIEINLSQNEPKKNLFLIDSIIENKKLSKKSVDLLKIKKTILIFDDLEEKEIIKLLNIDDKENKFLPLSIQLVNDHSKSKKLLKIINDKHN